MKTIAIMNNKGGVGKTVTAVNLADILVRDCGKTVVLCDCDGQMNLTRFFLPGFDPEVCSTLADVFTGDAEAVWIENLVPVMPGLNILPGSPALYDLDLRAVRDGAGNPYALKQFCDAAASDGETDFFICDCPPGYTLASVAALLAADEVVVPMLLDGFSFTGMLDIQTQLEGLREAICTTGKRVDIAGVLLTQWHNSEVVRQGEQLVRDMGIPVFRTVIRRTDKVPESTFERTPIVRYSPTSAAARDYRTWVQEYFGENM